MGEAPEEAEHGTGGEQRAQQVPARSAGLETLQAAEAVGQEQQHGGAEKAAQQHELGQGVVGQQPFAGHVQADAHDDAAGQPGNAAAE